MAAVDEGSYEVGVSHDLAALLIDKLGSRILDQPLVRKSIIQGLPEDKRKALQSSANLADSNFWTLEDYYGGSWNLAKSERFVEALGLDRKYIKRISTETREHSELINPGYGEAVRLKGFLHFYQKRVKDGINSSLKHPDSRLMVQMPTGSGKTFTALETFVDLLRAPAEGRPRLCVWLVNSPELAEQALISFRDLWTLKGDKPLTTWRLYKKWGPPGIEELTQDSVIFSTYDIIHSILKRRDSRLISLDNLIKQTEYLIVDEAHTATADTYKACIERFIYNGKTRLLGLSATPVRQSREGTEDLINLFRGNILKIEQKENGDPINNPIRYLQECGYLAKVNWRFFETNVSASGRDEKKLLSTLSRSKSRNKLIIDQIRLAHNNREKTILFSCSVPHLLIIQTLCRTEKIPVEIIIEETTSIERQEIFERFTNDDTFYVILNYELLSTGIDLPNVNTLIITRPLRSSVQYSQMVGRALRGPKNGGNETNKIINLKDNITHFGRYESLFTDLQEQWDYHK